MEKLFPLFIVLYTFLALLSSLGRPDFNVSIAVFGIFFHKSFDDKQRYYFMLSLLLCVVLDIAWLSAGSDVDGILAAEGVTFPKGVRMAAFVVSLVNLFVKLGLLALMHLANRKRTEFVPHSHQEQQHLSPTDLHDVAYDDASEHSQEAPKRHLGKDFDAARH
eukprot:TRINITY_DN2537_c1_g3_i3.p1 TRINITY_DN2537_c1_g3~~TRINITY_DN2537_c1_g3_i3.p1  ORF type:complete len:176 (-),score=67.91 TRINITY_DN2537_c1_g3_i3:136-624(-)